MQDRTTNRDNALDLNLVGLAEEPIPFSESMQRSLEQTREKIREVFSSAHLDSVKVKRKDR